jgi:predicted amidohydrolase
MEDGMASRRPMRFNVATVTMTCHQDPAANIRKIITNIRAIMNDSPETKLIVFGEMILGWYDPAGLRDSCRDVSLSVSHETMGPLSSIAKEFGIYICLGFSENRDGTLHNSQLLFDTMGDPHAIHRKWYLTQDELECGYIPGESGFTITGIMGLKTAMVIGSDLYNLHNIRKLCWKDPDLIIHSVAEVEDPHLLGAKYRARLLDTWIITSNRYGLEDDLFWDGHTVISDHWGSIKVASSGEEAILIHQLRIPGRNILLSLLRKVITRIPIPLMLLFHGKRLRKFRQH